MQRAGGLLVLENTVGRNNSKCRLVKNLDNRRAPRTIRGIGNRFVDMILTDRPLQLERLYRRVDF